MVKIDEKNERSAEIVVTFENSDFDVDTYLENYTGFTKIRRMLCIAVRCPLLKNKLIERAHKEIKSSTNTILYKEIWEKHVETLTELGLNYDESWVNTVDADAYKTLDKLELELNSYRTNMIRDSIRTGNNELGNFYFKRGDFPNSLKCYMRMRDYCTSPKHVFEMCLNIIRVAYETGNYPLVSQYVSKAESAFNGLDETERKSCMDIYSKLQIASGLSHLDSSNYKEAALKFLSVHDDLENGYNDVISDTDIAAIGGMLTVVSFDRVELREMLASDTHFKNYLEKTPKVEDILLSYHEAEYPRLFKTLKEIENELSIDLFFGSHVEKVIKMIREKAICQYVSPFSSVDMNKMSVTFGTDVKSLEKELAKLIQDKSILARIDSHNKILYAKQSNQKNVTFKTIQKLGSNYQIKTEKNLLRMNVLKHQDFAVKPLKKMGVGAGAGMMNMMGGDPRQHFKKNL